MTHREIDTLSYDMHVFLSQRLRRRPDLLPRLEQCVERWLELPTSQSGAPYMREWLETLRHGSEAAIALATEQSERGQVLRKCSPFGTLWESPQERWQFLRDWKQARESRHV